MLAAADRRSSTAFWNTIAWPTGRRACAPQAMVPVAGATRPWSMRNSVLLPEPFGPSTAVNVPRSMTRSTSPTRRVPWRATPACRQRIGSPAALSSITCKRPTAHKRGGGVQQQHDEDQDDAERQRERQVALAGLQ